MSLLAFVLAMLGKGSVAILPVLLLGIMWWMRPLKNKRDSASLRRSRPTFCHEGFLRGSRRFS